MSESAHEHFWSQSDRMVKLKSILNIYSKTMPKSAEKIADYCGDVYNPKYVPQHGAARRFIAEGQKSIKNHQQLSGLLFYAKTQVTILFEGDPEKYALELKKLTELLEDYSNCKDIAPPEKLAKTLPEPETNILNIAIQLVADFLGIDKEAFYNSVDAFVRDGEHSHIAKDGGEENHFICYRYSSTPGQIAKSFNFIRKPTSTIPVARFGNVLQDGEGAEPRIAQGIVLPFEEMTCFIGQIDSGSAAKIMVFEKPTRFPKVHKGIIISIDRDYRPIASRIVMKRILPIKDTSPRAHKVIGSGVFPEESIVDEEIPDLKELIDNSVSSKLDSNIIFRGRTARITDIVALLEDAAFEKPNNIFSKDGSPLDLMRILSPTGNSAMKIK